MTPASIRDLIAASDGSDQKVILRQAFVHFVENLRPHNACGQYFEWEKICARFEKMLDADAPTEAALMIAKAVLPGWEIASSPTYAEIRENPPPATYDEQPYELTGLTSGTGPTRALAIIDAVCAAVEKGEG